MKRLRWTSTSKPALRATATRDLFFYSLGFQMNPAGVESEMTNFVATWAILHEIQVIDNISYFGLDDTLCYFSFISSLCMESRTIQNDLETLFFSASTSSSLLVSLLKERNQTQHEVYCSPYAAGRVGGILSGTFWKVNNCKKFQTRSLSRTIWNRWRTLPGNCQRARRWTSGCPRSMRWLGTLRGNKSVSESSNPSHSCSWSLGGSFGPTISWLLVPSWNQT